MLSFNSAGSHKGRMRHLRQGAPALLVKTPISTLDQANQRVVDCADQAARVEIAI
jgi:hypothetical protein